MTADAPKRRGRPLKPLVGDPFAAPSFDEERRKRWADLVAALAKVDLDDRPGGKSLLLGEVLAEKLSEAAAARPKKPLHPTLLKAAEKKSLSFRYGSGAGQASIPRDAREEAVDQWLRQRADLPWLQSIDAAQRPADQRPGEVQRWGKRHLVLAKRLEAFAAAPHDPALAEAAAEALGKLPPEPRLPGVAPLEPDPERLTRERLRKAPGGDPGERDATAAAAKELAAECRRVAADVVEWLKKEHNTRHGRRALAHTVAVVVADLFDAAGVGEAVVFNRQGAVAAGLGARGPVGPYCVAVEAALEALDPHLSTSWRPAAEEVRDARRASAGAGG